MSTQSKAERATISPEIMQKIRRVELRAGHLVNEAFVGGYLSSFKGQGMEWEDVRSYVPGDDVRRIDWKVSAKIGETKIKQFKEERELVIYLLIDVSHSCLFGSQGATKAERMAELAAALAFCTTRNHDKIGVLFFSDTVEKHIPPGAGKAHIFRLIREILTHSISQQPSSSTGTRVLPAVNYLCKIRSKKTAVFLLSDFYMNDLEESIKKLALRHSTTLMWMRDGLETSLPPTGILPIMDLETHEVVWMDFSNTRNLQQFAKKQNEHLQKNIEIARINRAKLLVLENTEQYIDKVIAFFREIRPK